MYLDFLPYFADLCNASAVQLDVAANYFLTDWLDLGPSG